MTVLYASACVAVLFAAIYFGYVAADKTFGRDIYTDKTAYRLLEQEDVDGWNSLREVRPNWQPDLKGLDFARKNLSGVNLSRSNLIGANFESSILVGADFTGATVDHAKFNAALLRELVAGSEVLTAIKRLGGDVAEQEVGATSNSGSSGGIAGAADSEKDGPGDLLPGPNVRIEQLAKLSPPQFERFVGELVKRLGYTVDVAPQNSGVDLFIQQMRPLGLFKGVVEVRRLSEARRAVNPSVIATARAMKSVHGAQLAIVVTNGLFSSSAVQLAAKDTDVQLINGTDLIRMMGTLA